MWIIDKIKGMFNKFLAAAKDFIKMALPDARQIILGQLAIFATQTVARLNGVDMTDDEKRNQAFNDIKGYAVQNGIQARDSLIHAAIALAVLTFKTDF